MKGKNRDIIIAKQGNIPNFSKVDNIVTPLRLLELFFDYVFDMIFGNPKFYIIERKQALFLKLLLKLFAYWYACYWLVGTISFPCIGRQPPIPLCKQGLIQCFLIYASVFLINKKIYQSALQ